MIHSIEDSYLEYELHLQIKTCNNLLNYSIYMFSNTTIYDLTHERKVLKYMTRNFK